MKPSKISILTTSAVLLLAAGLLSGCGGDAEDAGDQNKEVIGDSVQDTQEYVEPMLNIDEYGRISSADEDEGMQSIEGFEGIEESMDEGFESASDMMDAVSEATDDAVDEGMEAADSMLDFVEDGVEDAQELIVEVQEDVVEGVSSAIDELPTEALMDDGADVVGATSEIIRGVQQGLVDAGLNPGPVDGFSGPRTTAALESYQQQNGLAVGQLTKETLRALGVDF